MEEYLDRYKEIAQSYRILIWGLLGLLLPALYKYTSEVDALQMTLQNKKNEKFAEQASFDKARKQITNLPKLEEQLEFTNKELFEAKKRLPDDFNIDQYLADVSKEADKYGIELALFDPLVHTTITGVYSYDQLPIKININGKFDAIMSFLDGISHLESMIYLKDLKFNTKVEIPNDVSNMFRSSNYTAETQNAMLSRKYLLVNAEVHLLVYRTSQAVAPVTPGNANGVPTASIPPPVR